MLHCLFLWLWYTSSLLAHKVTFLSEKLLRTGPVTKLIYLTSKFLAQDNDFPAF